MLSTSLDQSLCESEAYEGDISLVDSSASVEISEAQVSEGETDVSEQGDSHVYSRCTSSPHSISRSYLHRVRQPKGLTSSRSDLRKQVVHARLQAELIRAQSRIVQLDEARSRTQGARVCCEKKKRGGEGLGVTFVRCLLNGDYNYALLVMITMFSTILIGLCLVISSGQMASP